VSRLPQFLQHLFGVYEMAILELLLRSGQCSMEEGSVFRTKPVSRIEREEIDLSSFREIRRLVQHQPAVVNAGFESHTRRLAPRRAYNGGQARGENRYSSRRAATHSFSASSMRVCQPSPLDLK